MAADRNDQRTLSNSLAFLDTYPDPELTTDHSFEAWFEKIQGRFDRLPRRINTDVLRSWAQQWVPFLIGHMAAFNLYNRFYAFSLIFSIAFLQWLLILRQPRRSTDSLARIKELQWGFQLGVTLCAAAQFPYSRSDFLLPLILKTADADGDRGWIKGDIRELLQCRLPAMIAAVILEPRILAPPMWIQGSVILLCPKILGQWTGYHVLALLASPVWVTLVIWLVAVSVDFVFALGVLNAVSVYVVMKWSSALWREGFPDERMRAIEEEWERESLAMSSGVGERREAGGGAVRAVVEAARRRGGEGRIQDTPATGSSRATQSSPAGQGSAARRSTRRRRDSPERPDFAPLFQSLSGVNEPSDAGPDPGAPSDRLEARSWREALLATYMVYRTWLYDYLCETLWALYLVSVRLLSLYTTYRVATCLLRWGTSGIGVLLDPDRIRRVFAALIRVLRWISLTVTDVDLIRKPFLAVSDPDHVRNLVLWLQEVPWTLREKMDAVSAMVAEGFNAALQGLKGAGAAAKKSVSTPSVKKEFVKEQGRGKF
ncbi:uncharacterized protein EI97DRAFT_460240 [Westerdykella ornata]|uniref:Uncharacterized protein n=1 Tax=Westerdykella ornata TaxID=318751 RepID=A0A6A6JCU2_WESOR|nr:uncharacterized protein EI97DRAFT_460240 [Westerdykella ornata]KAF2274381.1 hypothetical protein EI97DRAFT_460240 [Westerdykella ornata]